jgi:hypothetical protein
MLERLGFDVIRLFNGDFSKIRDAIRTFNAAVSEAEIGVVYYAGHGMELGGENWLIPVDAGLRTTATCRTVGQPENRDGIGQPGEQAWVGYSRLMPRNPFLAKMNRGGMTRCGPRFGARGTDTECPRRLRS